MNTSDHQAAFLLDLCKLVVEATARGFKLTQGEAWRPPEMQAIYVKTGRSKTMESNHGKRMAQDLNFFWQGELTYDKALLAPLGAYWESLSPLNRWGGNFKSIKDVPHFERHVV
jgi:hypothetical protein